MWVEFGGGNLLTVNTERTQVSKSPSERYTDPKTS